MRDGERIKVYSFLVNSGVGEEGSGILQIDLPCKEGQ